MGLDRSLAERPPHEQVRELLAGIGIDLEQDLVGHDTDGIPRLLHALRGAAASVEIERATPHGLRTFAVRWRAAGTRTAGGVIVTTMSGRADVAASDAVDGPIHTATPRGPREVAPTLAQHVVAAVHRDVMHAQRFQLRGELEPGTDPEALLRQVAPMPGGCVGRGFLGLSLEPIGSLFPKRRFWAGASQLEALVDLWDDRWGWATVEDEVRTDAARSDVPGDVEPTERWDLDHVGRRLARWDELERELVAVRAGRLPVDDPARPFEITRSHHRRLRPPLAPASIDEVDERLGVALPVDHRRFVTELGDGIEAGTALRPLAATLERSDVAGPFRLRRTISPVWGDGVTPDPRADATYDDWRTVGRGTLDIADLGCGMVARLVVRGDDAEIGSVWRDDTPNSGSVSFWRTSFRSYVERWLDRQIDETQRLVDRRHRVPLAQREGLRPATHNGGSEGPTRGDPDGPTGLNRTAHPP